MKRIALALCLALALSTAHASTGKSLFVSFNDGSRIEFALSGTPDVSFGNDRMTVTTTSTTASYDLWTVSAFTYGATTGIENAENGRLTVEANRIVVDGTHNKVSAFSTDGKAVNIATVVADGKTIVGIGSLAKGIYIININGKAIKITRR